MIETKRHKYTSGLIVEDGRGPSVGEFNPPDTSGSEWTLVEVKYILLPSGVRWVARWQQNVLIIDTPQPTGDLKP